MCKCTSVCLYVCVCIGNTFVCVYIGNTFIRGGVVHVQRH